MDKKLIKSSACEIAKAIKNRETTSSEVYSFFQKRITKLNPSLNIFIDIYKNSSSLGGLSALAGVPIGIKDNISIKGKKITCASSILASHKAVYDATVIEKIKSSGLSLMGTTNMDEFAFGSSTENSCYGPAKNPWDKTRVVGGSSGGSAAAVAARLVPFALGSDTGGSIRQPASFCGVVGLKPTYGRVSRYGLVAFGSSLDQIGPITTNIEDCAHLLNVISGFDSSDSTSAKLEPGDFTESLGKDIANLKIGIPKEYFDQGLDPEVKKKLDQAIDFFKKKKVKFKEISLPHTQYAVPTYYIISSSEASSNLQRFDGIRYGKRVEADNLLKTYQKSRHQGLGNEAKRRIFLGTYSLSSGYYDAYYLKALKVRKLIKNDFDQAFQELDAIITPTSPSPAFKIGQKTEDPLSMYLSDIYTISSNLAGVPAISLPCGFTKNNLPLGMQLITKEFDEATLMKLGSAFQQGTDFHKKIPELGNV
ncbi:MAG: Asp-tRNA(Asn)/Glu-tRNA(Gln) amidotransferase subunit GatA [Candidatus Omnitrophica bacterium]|nr:Asp-tRNA(Asn)/Glu-tRNA(Gln) amidotransferase subunit GatA [Candidatus Omnitrophota bacterium]MCF7893999.1 Asp-tRNA(Asn)/Glu-tRNA(Gln) amidotransferase subunit GatA [Candidatus Omnitrophota bacterium]